MNKLDCTTAEVWIVKALDEGLDLEHLVLLDEHLAGCSSCRRTRAATADVLSVVARDVPEEPSEDFWRLYRQSLHARLAEKDSPAPSWRKWRFTAVAAVAGIALLVVGLWRAAPLLDQASRPAEISHEIIADLEQLYGPVQEEIAAPALSRDQLYALSGIGGYGREVIIGWFEVEDEPDNLLL